MLFCQCSLPLFRSHSAALLPSGQEQQVDKTMQLPEASLIPQRHSPILLPAKAYSRHYTPIHGVTASISRVLDPR